MRTALLELSTIAQPLNRLAHWVAQRASNDQVVTEPQAIDVAQLQLLVRPRLGKVRRVALRAANSDRLMDTPAAPSLTLASHNGQASAATSAGTKRPALRVVVKTGAKGEPNRMVISGRMADVCAELDRLAHEERQLQPCA
ncbi:hypothetical protein [Diaphorobacter sp.]|uniref:hypothetical protein n=1 Tax=Diaphorobacter sp. TaxID=1934310 RepID=UPI0028AD2EC0|nr:hypothetical protein [Diaphorobacter sp.]